MTEHWRWNLILLKTSSEYWKYLKYNNIKNNADILSSLKKKRKLEGPNFYQNML